MNALDPTSDEAISLAKSVADQLAEIFAAPTPTIRRLRLKRFLYRHGWWEPKFDDEGQLTNG